ncbi:NADPH:quinone reductase [Albidovulum sediminicola]|uniref:NADPH:quinone reductase n=1 Tax=Albidovulum sediminicola TaxID=2984331 RepID=A0ABT2YWD9_9RHOB|nr:NADPH:quinone reductase [Defluviimonas sp. WL0075]MCV2863177.1 NADPH:quinone reductase [Defluviimonas sp. WL0075]
MKALFNIARGSARDTLRILPAEIPEPGPGQVRVRVAVSGVNPSDVKLRSGAQGPMVADKVIVHNDGAGVIDAVGAGVDPGRVGERVWLFNANRSPSGVSQGTVGTAAEYVCVNSLQAAPLPEGVSYEIGACLGVPAMTAHRAVLAAGPVRGRTLLVTGGAGAVGHSAIQIATGLGARVIATVSSAEKAEIARAAGAEVTIDYRTEDLGARLLEVAGDSGVDHVVDVDLAAHVGLYPRIIRPGGSAAAYATATNLTPSIPFYPLAMRNISLHPVYVYSIDEGAKMAAIGDINALLAEGRLAPRIARVFAFDDFVAAHEAQETGALSGNAVLRL